MKNNAVNGLVGIILGGIFLTEIYVRIGLTIYGLWSASKVLKDKNVRKRDRIIAIFCYAIGIPLIIVSFYFFFAGIFINK